MSFGLTNAPRTFQRVIDKIERSDLKFKVFTYLDNIIIVTQNFDNRLYYLSLVLDKLNRANLKLNCHIVEGDIKLF